MFVREADLYTDRGCRRPVARPAPLQLGLAKAHSRAHAGGELCGAARHIERNARNRALQDMRTAVVMTHLQPARNSFRVLLFDRTGLQGRPDSGVFLKITADDARGSAGAGHKASFANIKRRRRGVFDVCTSAAGARCA